MKIPIEHEGKECYIEVPEKKPERKEPSKALAIVSIIVAMVALLKTFL